MASSKVIRLALSDDSSLIELSGDLEALRRDSRMRISLKRIDPQYNPANPVIHLGDREPYVVLRMLREALNARGYVDNCDSASSEVLDQFYRDERSFASFSEQACRIRNNQGDTADFGAFEKTLGRVLPKRSLYPLQLLSAYHLAFSQNACNFSVPGAGKTSIVYGAYAYLRSLEEGSGKCVRSLVIIGPLSSFGPWEDEFYACFGRRPRSVRLDSSLTPEERKNYLIGGEPADITLVSYQSLPGLASLLKGFLARNKSMLVLDEAHKIKNTNGGTWATAALDIARSASSRVVLTGTPAPNGYEDLYNLFNFIWPGRNVAKFKVNQLSDMSKDENDARIPRLISYLEPYYLRIRKSDLHLPQVCETPLRLVEMGPLQREIYDAVEKHFMEPLVDADLDDEGARRSALAKVVRLMQAASDPSCLIAPTEDAEQVQALPERLVDLVKAYAVSEVPAKYKTAESIVREVLARGEKIIIWVNFVSTLQKLEDYLAARGITAKTLYGQTPTGSYDDDFQLVQTRERIIREFNDGESDLRVVIANPAAVAESISLHHACHTALYLERGFNAAQFLQSKDRIHRYGLDSRTITTYHYLASRGTIDEVIDERLHLKEERMMRIVESSDIPLFDNVVDGLGKDDIKALIRDYASRTNAM